MSILHDSTTPLRIAFDGTTLCGKDGNEGAGIEHYTRSLLRALVEVFPTDLFFVTVPRHCSRAILRRSFTQRNIRFFSALFPYTPFLSRHLFLPLRLALARADILFCPSGQLPFVWRGKCVMTVHDTAIYDHPEWFSEEQAQAWSTRFCVPWSIKRADALIAVSQDTASRLSAFFPAAEKKTYVIYEGVELGHQKKVSQTDRFPFDRDYILFLGTIEPRKNLPNAFLAFQHFLQGHPEQKGKLRFIVAGKKGWNVEESVQAAEDVNRAVGEKMIEWLGPVTEEEKWYLLSRAACVLFPSWHEGFGLPILEAMSVGTPVITTQCGAIPEVGGDAVIYVEPDDLEMMSFAIAQCVLVPEGTFALREEGYRRATSFSWEETAKKTIALLRSVCDRN